MHDFHLNNNVNLWKLLRMTSVVEYQGDLRTRCVHLQSQSALLTDAPTDNQGKGEQFSPTDLLATSLASCMLTVMGIKAQQLHINMQGFTLSVTKIMAANPRRVSAIELTASIPETIQQLDTSTKEVLKKLEKVALLLKAYTRILKYQLNGASGLLELLQVMNHAAHRQSHDIIKIALNRLDTYHTNPFLNSIAPALS